MSERNRAAREGPESEPRRWWRISEQAWYTQVLAALTLVATALGVFFGVRQVLPDPEPSKPVKNNFAILLDRSESMGGMLGDTTKLENAAEKVLETVEIEESVATARGLWYFGGRCGGVDESVNLDRENASEVRTALEHPPRTRGDRPLIQALDSAVNALANVPATLGGGDVKTVRRIVVFTDGPDECDDDLSRVTTSLEQSAIQVEFHIVGVDLTPTDRDVLNGVAQSLPGVGGEPARVIDEEDLNGENPLEPVTTTTTTAPTTTTTPPTTSPPTTSPPTTVTPSRPRAT